MRKILFIAAALILSICAYAQSESAHLAFKGVPIDGTLNQFITNMKAKGFLSEGSRDGTAVLKGDFAGYKGCYIVVSTLKNKDLVSTIGVMFPECSTWSTLEGNYSKLKEMLTTKYGKPADVTEEFQGYKPKDDNSKLHELKMDRCVYQTVFKTDKGTIVLKLIHDEIMNCHVLLGYNDKLNGIEVEAAAMDDL